METLPNRKQIRIKNYDYATPGTYFITVCTASREKIFWNSVGADIIRPGNLPLSASGKIAEQAVLQIASHYENVSVIRIASCPITSI